jgi:galactokinase
MPAPAPLPPTVTPAVAAARAELGLVGELRAAWAPGRVNLIGEHTDYNGGFVLPIAIERTVALAGHGIPDPHVRLYSVHHGATATFSLDAPPSAQEPAGAPAWARYVAGVVAEARAAGLPLGGFAAAIAGDVPLGGGMSSSAALIVATLTWLAAINGWELAPLDLARMGQRAEHRGAGVQVGIMDHAASLLGRPGQAMLLDCRSLEYRYIPFQGAATRLLVCESGVAHALAASSGYNARRQECADAAARFAALLPERAIHTLRDVTERDLARLAHHLPETLRQRARHVVGENARVLAAVTALEADDISALGALVLASHASLRDDYAVSAPELDHIVEVATRRAEIPGARMIGAGFGGSVLIVLAEKDVEAIQADLRTMYQTPDGTPPTMHLLAPAGGPGTALIA